MLDESVFRAIANVFNVLAFFAMVGVLALLGGFAYLVYWMFTHLVFSVAVI